MNEQRPPTYNTTLSLQKHSDAGTADKSLRTGTVPIMFFSNVIVIMMPVLQVMIIPCISNSLPPYCTLSMNSIFLIFF